MNNDELEEILCFPTIVYKIQKPIFFERVRKVALDSLTNIKNGIDDIYPVKMTEDISQDPTIQDFCEYVALTASGILSQQGYDIRGKAAYFDSMWCQEHHKHSMMEQHVHPGDIQMVGFYFLDTPEGSSVATFYDPRAGKVQGGRSEENIAEITYASNAFNVKPEPGMLILINAWLAHSFTRQMSDSPFRFIHFNIALTDNVVNNQCKAADEIV